MVPGKALLEDTNPAAVVQRHSKLCRVQADRRSWEAKRLFAFSV